MPVSKNSAGRPPTGAPGVKLLITATSLVATIGGWAMLSSTEGVSSSSAPPSAPAQPVARALNLNLAPLPTLVPPPDPKSIAINAQPVIAPRSNRPAAAAAPAPAPQIAGLRVVDAPAAASGGGGSVAGAPAPATTTRSSKP